MNDPSFHAGSSFELLPGGKTRIKTYADGGALISDELVTTEDAVKRIRGRRLPEENIDDEWYPENSYLEPKFEQTGDIREFPENDIARRVLDIVNAQGEIDFPHIYAHFLDDTSTSEINDALQSLVRNGKIRCVSEGIFARLENPAPGCGTTIDHLYL